MRRNSFSLAPMARLCAKMIRAKKRSPIVALLKDTIRREGPISIERYMEIVLQHPDHGYYRRGDPIGSDSDFSTAPEVSQTFGEMLGVWALNAWESLGKPSSFALLELGPGHGTLMHDLLRFTAPVPEFMQALRVRFYESNATLRDLQAQKLEAYSPQHLATLSDLEPMPTLVIANEFFDNLPTRQFIKEREGWRETKVGLKFWGFDLVSGKDVYELPPDPAALAFLANRPEGWIHEISEASRVVVKQLAAHVVGQGGAAAIIDYGYDDPPGRATLDAWCQSCATDILKSPGETDVTADVDFFAFREVAKAEGARVSPIVGQGKFLAELGILTRADFLKKALPDRAARIDEDMEMFLSPKKMGEFWKVLTFDAPIPLKQK